MAMKKAQETICDGCKADLTKAESVLFRLEPTKLTKDHKLIIPAAMAGKSPDEDQVECAACGWAIDHHIETVDDPSGITVISVTPGEHAAILAGLRLVQKFIESNTLSDWSQDILTNGGTVKPLTPKNIDRLCERINT